MKDIIDIPGWLQNVAEKAEEIREAIWSGTLPDTASRDADYALQAILKEAYVSMEIYERECWENVRQERDPGPSQEQRL